jgi:KaiC/GvpD/RAD55 family RecA-like ATPase
METKLALIMDLPDGKLPGFYAQIIKALADKVRIFDRDKEMLIVSTEEERESVLEVMKRYKIATEPMELLLLPDNAMLTDAFSDYGFISRADNTYVYAKLICSFHLLSEESASESDQALDQLDEHLIAQFTENGKPVYLVDNQLEELVQGIAKAYSCQISILQ